jgi:hypothetical protein
MNTTEITIKILVTPQGMQYTTQETSAAKVSEREPAAVEVMGMDGKENGNPPQPMAMEALEAATGELSSQSPEPLSSEELEAVESQDQEPLPLSPEELEEQAPDESNSPEDL